MDRDKTLANLARTYYGLATLDSPEEPTDFLGHFTTATRIALTQAYDNGYEDGHAQGIDDARTAFVEPPRAEDQEAARLKLFAEIARKELRIPTLAHRKSDQLDFHEVSVWGVQAALEAAYAAGRTAPPLHAEPDHDPPPDAALATGEPDRDPPPVNQQAPVVEHHRNGVGGAPFDVILFTDAGPHGSRKLGIVFAAERHVAVFDLAKLAAGDIAFGSNSWRGDQLEPRLRRLIADRDAAG